MHPRPGFCGAVFKRLGFLSEAQPTGERLANACSAHLTKGNAKLDPALPCLRLISRWNLWVPDFWVGSARMIDKREILDMATRMSLTPHLVEKDYVLGWMLAGIKPIKELTIRKSEDFNTKFESCSPH